MPAHSITSDINFLTPIDDLEQIIFHHLDYLSVQKISANLLPVRLQTIYGELDTKIV